MSYHIITVDNKNLATKIVQELKVCWSDDFTIDFASTCEDCFTITVNMHPNSGPTFRDRLVSMRLQALRITAESAKPGAHSNESTPTASKPKSYHVITVKGEDNADRIVNALSANFDEQFYHRLTECDTDAAYAITVKFASNYAYDVNFIKERLSEIRICASLHLMENDDAPTETTIETPVRGFTAISVADKAKADKLVDAIRTKFDSYGGISSRYVYWDYNVTDKLYYIVVRYFTDKDREWTVADDAHLVDSIVEFAETFLAGMNA